MAASASALISRMDDESQDNSKLSDIVKSLKKILATVKTISVTLDKISYGLDGVSGTQYHCIEEVPTS
jgi:hypothetical protein